MNYQSLYGHKQKTIGRGSAGVQREGLSHDCIPASFIGGVNNKQIIVSILLFAIAVSLVISVIIPCSEQIKSTGDKTFGIVKNLNDNMR